MHLGRPGAPRGRGMGNCVHAFVGFWGPLQLHYPPSSRTRPKQQTTAKTICQTTGEKISHAVAPEPRWPNQVLAIAFNYLYPVQKTTRECEETITLIKDDNLTVDDIHEQLNNTAMKTLGAKYGRSPTFWYDIKQAGQSSSSPHVRTPGCSNG